MSRTKKLCQTAKFSLYVLMLLVFYALQTTPGLFQVYGIRPIWMVPLAVAIAMCEGEVVGACFGGAAGLLCDLGSQSLFGFNGLCMVVGCTAVGLLSIHLVKASWKSALLMGGGLAAVRALLEFFFFYAIWNYEKIWLIFVRSVFPIFVYTVLLTPLFFWLVRKIKSSFDGRWQE